MPEPGDRVTYVSASGRDFGLVREVAFDPINGFSIRARWDSIGESPKFFRVALMPNFEILKEGASPTLPKGGSRLCPNRGCQKPNDIGAKACWFCEGVFK